MEIWTDWHLIKITSMPHLLSCTSLQVSQNVPVRLLGPRFTNAISCFKPGPQESYRDILKTPCAIYSQGGQPYLTMMPYYKFFVGYVLNKSCGQLPKPFWVLPRIAGMVVVFNQILIISIISWSK
jgi:hypothetical protein